MPTIIRGRTTTRTSRLVRPDPFVCRSPLGSETESVAGRANRREPERSQVRGNVGGRAATSSLVPSNRRGGPRRTSQPLDCESDGYVSRRLPNRRPSDEPPDRHPRRPGKQYEDIADNRHPRQEHRGRSVLRKQRACAACSLALRYDRDGCPRQPVRRACTERVARGRHDDRNHPLSRAPDHERQRHFRRQRQDRRCCETPAE